MDILPGLFCEDEVVARFKPFGLNLRTLRRYARAKGIGRKFSRHWFFTENGDLRIDEGGKGDMLKLAKRRGSSSFYARGAYLGERVFESLGTRDRGEAERLLATLQNGIFERRRVVAFSPSRGS